MNGVVVSVNLSATPYKSYEENIEGFNHQRFLYAQHSPTNETLQSVLDSTKHVKKYNISKQPQDQINLDIGGVVGDTHFFPITEIEENGERFLQRRIAEVNFFQLTEYDRLNQLFGTNVGPGSLGENITTAGINLDSLPVNTILQVGSAKVKILARRSFCFKFVNTFMPDKDFWTLADRQKFDRARVGIVGQVIEPGVVKASDTITAILSDQIDPMPIPAIPEKYTRNKVIDEQLPSMLK
ncbi:Molybdenum cofactor sulfurase, C-terminal [uncultured Caudovirales phage]|uniref:Molybdenum cofactor sulfurase, C-terminal n=1 Tax=uncultured Caudovirales phage TaxID=2100421 RepID=A0A6J5TC04_9CAUD|nr:Molybdenum cofactor sulfurase, C-terminal [uncultured Caudovirales phage]